MGDCFILLAGRTPPYVALNVEPHIGPPIVLPEALQGFPYSGVTSRDAIVIML